MLLRDRVVLVAGAGPGLGSALAERIVAHGGRVVLTARSADRLRALQERLGDAASHIPADVRRRTDAERVVAHGIEAFGRLDGLVHNAAVVPPLQPVTESDDNLGEVLAVSVDGALNLTRASVPALRAAGGGSIVLVGSAVVRHPKPGFGAYNIGKHAALGLARSLALELGPAGIRVNTLAPGKIEGARLTTYLADQARRREISLDEVRREYASRIALGRIPAPEEYADAAVFLLSDLSRAVTGHVLDANGGEYFD